MKSLQKLIVSNFVLITTLVISCGKKPVVRVTSPTNSYDKPANCANKSLTSTWRTEKGAILDLTKCNFDNNQDSHKACTAKYINAIDSCDSDLLFTETSFHVAGKGCAVKFLGESGRYFKIDNKLILVDSNSPFLELSEPKTSEGKFTIFK